MAKGSEAVVGTIWAQWGEVGGGTKPDIMTGNLPTTGTNTGMTNGKYKASWLMVSQVLSVVLQSHSHNNLLTNIGNSNQKKIL